MNPDKISNEDYVVDNDEIMEDVTQEKNAENDKDQQEIEKMEKLLQEMYDSLTTQRRALKVSSMVAQLKSCVRKMNA